MVVAGKCYRCFDILRGFQLLQDIGPKWIFRFCQDLLIAHNESHSSSRKCDTNLFGLVMKLITRKLRTTCSKGINNKRSDSCSRKCNIKNYSQGYCGLQTFFSQSLWQGTRLLFFKCKSTLLWLNCNTTHCRKEHTDSSFKC